MAVIKLQGGGWRASVLMKKYGITLEQARQLKVKGSIEIADKPAKKKVEASDGSR